MYCILTFSPSFKTMEGAGGGEKEGRGEGGGCICTSLCKEWLVEFTFISQHCILT